MTRQVPPLRQRSDTYEGDSYSREILIIAYISFRFSNFPFFLSYSFSVLHVIEWYVEVDLKRHLTRIVYTNSQ
jgi:hypothetical protein